MAEPKDEGRECDEREIAMPAKRKPDLVAVTDHSEGESVKKQRSEPEPKPESESANGDDSSLVSKGKQVLEEYYERQITEEDYEDEEDEYYEDTDSSDDDDDDDDEDDSDEEEEGDGDGAKGEKSNGKEVVVDRKGKGILIEEKNNSDDEDDSDLEEDPLAEVDLDNILPTKTRGGGFRRSGISISDNARNNNNSKSSPN